MWYNNSPLQYRGKPFHRKLYQMITEKLEREVNLDIPILHRKIEEFIWEYYDEFHTKTGDEERKLTIKDVCLMIYERYNNPISKVYNNIDDFRLQLNQYEAKRKSAGVFGLTVSKEIILVVKHFKNESIADLPKGKQNPGETIQECAFREFSEEAGIKRTPIQAKRSFDANGVTFFVETNIPRYQVLSSHYQKGEVDGVITYQASLMPGKECIISPVGKYNTMYHLRLTARVIDVFNKIQKGETPTMRSLKDECSIE